MQPSRRSSCSLARALCLALLLPGLLLAKSFVKPPAQPAGAYPAHDSHPDDKVAIAADPYDTPEKAKVFTIDFARYGFLPVFFVVTNDGDKPISIGDMEIVFLTRNHSKLTPISPDDIYRRMANPQANTSPSASPIPIPHKKVKGTVSQKDMDEIDSARFAARAVEPHTTQSGFLFFDVGGISSPLAEANIDITGVDDAKGNELLYFEIPLQKYLSAQPKP